MLARWEVGRRPAGEGSGPEDSRTPCGPYTWIAGASLVLGCGEWLRV